MAMLRTAALNLLRLAGFRPIRAGIQVVMHDIKAPLAMAGRQPAPNLDRDFESALALAPPICARRRRIGCAVPIGGGVAPATALGEAALLARAARGLPLIALREGLDPPMLQRALAAVRDGAGWSADAAAMGRPGPLIALWPSGVA